MKRLVFASVLLLSFTTSVMAEEAERSAKTFYTMFGLGKTDNVSSNIDTASSLPNVLGMGYGFNRHVSAEVTMLTLYSLADIKNTGNCCDVASLEGNELAALFKLPMGSDSFGFVRLAYAQMKSSSRINGVDYSSDLTGTGAGIGFQFRGAHEGRMGFRIGLNQYSLKNSNGVGASFEPVFAYVSLVF